MVPCAGVGIAAANCGGISASRGPYWDREKINRKRKKKKRKERGKPSIDLALVPTVFLTTTPNSGCVEISATPTSI